MRGQGRVFHPTWTDPKTGDRHIAETWRLDYSINGKRHLENAHTTSKREALLLLHERVGDRRAGKLTGDPDRVTVDNLCTGLKRHYERAGNRSLRRCQQALAHLRTFFQADTRALSVSKARVGEYLTHRLAEGAARGTVRYEVAVLNTAFSVALENELPAMRPMFKLPAVNNARSGFFDDGDLAALLLELPADVRPVIRFASLTGWRKSEVLGLTWEQVDWEGQVIRLRATDTKGKDSRCFPFGLAPDLKALLEERWQARDGLFVFHRQGASGSGAFGAPGRGRVRRRGSRGGWCMTSGAPRRARSGGRASRRGRS